LSKTHVKQPDAYGKIVVTNVKADPELKLTRNN